MTITRFKSPALLLAFAGLSACATYGGGGYYGDRYGETDYPEECYDKDGYLYEECEDASYVAQRGYGYGSNYLHSGYGPYGWYDGFYYPGYSFYVYDRLGHRHHWRGAHQRHWEGRRDGRRGHRGGDHDITDRDQRPPGQRGTGRRGRTGDGAVGVPGGQRDAGQRGHRNGDGAGRRGQRGNTVTTDRQGTDATRAPQADPGAVRGDARRRRPRFEDGLNSRERERDPVSEQGGRRGNGSATGRQGGAGASGTPRRNPDARQGRRGGNGDGARRGEQRRNGAATGQQSGGATAAPPRNPNTGQPGRARPAATQRQPAETRAAPTPPRRPARSRRSRRTGEDIDLDSAE